MIFTETKLAGAYVIEPERLEDERGFFARIFCAETFAERGLMAEFPQCSVSCNDVKGTLRGMHYQTPPHAEAKLVRCTMGKIWDVIIDLRPTSPTYAKWYGVEMSEDNRKMIYIPEGFAHGFQTLTDNSEIYYQISNSYHPESARGVMWDDPAFQIDWPLPVSKIGNRDRHYGPFKMPQSKSPALNRNTDGALHIALFATGSVGREIAKFLADSDDLPACLVLDSADRNQSNEGILSVCHVDPDRVFYSDQLDDEQVIGRLRTFDLDLGILAWWPYLIKRPLFDLTQMGFLNFHPSLLPRNRGKDPNFWAIVENCRYGVTLHFIDENVDCGDIAFSAEIPVTWEDTGGTLYLKAQRRIVELFKEKSPRIRRGDIPRIPQGEDQTSTHRRAELDPMTEIDLNRDYKAVELLRLLRARTFHPYPACRFSDGGETYQVRLLIERLKD